MKYCPTQVSTHTILLRLGTLNNSEEEEEEEEEEDEDEDTGRARNKRQLYFKTD